MQRRTLIAASKLWKKIPFEVIAFKGYLRRRMEMVLETHFKRMIAEKLKSSKSSVVDVTVVVKFYSEIG